MKGSALESKVGANITSLFALYSIITLVVMVILSIFFLAPQIEKTLIQQRNSATEAAIQLHAENIRQYFSDRAILLRDITQYPIVTTSTMTANSDSIELKELFAYTQILGESLPLAILDIEGEVIYSSDNASFSNNEINTWVETITSGENNFYLNLFQNESGNHFKIAVPIMFRGYVEGVLVTIIPSGAGKVLSGNIDDSSFYVELRQNNTLFTTQDKASDSFALTRTIKLPELDLELGYIIDKAPLLSQVKRIQKQILTALLIAVLVAFILFLIIGYRILVLPYQKLAETSKQLNKTSKELQLIFDNVPARIWFKDDRNKILRLNYQAAESMGMTIDQVEGKNTYDLFPDMARKYHDDDLEVINSGEARLGIIEEYTPLHADHGWSSTDKVPYTNPETGHKGILVVSKDITDLKGAESALAESEERYEVAVTGSSVGLWDWNVVTNELYWSPRFMEILGINESEFIPELSSFSDRLHHEDKDRIMTALNQHIETGTEYNVEYRLKHQKDHYIWIHARGQAIWDKAGNPIRCAGSIADISDRKRDEQALSESEERFRIAVTGSSVGVWDYDLINDQLYWSPLHMEMLGISTNEFTASGSEFFDRIHPDDKDFVSNAFDQHLLHREPYNLEMRLRHNDSHYIWIHVRGQALWDASGKATRIAGSSADISKRKNDEEALQKLYLLAAKSGLTLGQKINALLDLGCNYLDLEHAAICSITKDSYTVEYAQSNKFNIGDVDHRENSFCQSIIEADGLCVANKLSTESHSLDHWHSLHGFISFVGTPIEVNHNTWGTLCFCGDSISHNQLDQHEQAFVNLLAQWVGNEIDSEQRIATIQEGKKQLSESIEQLTHANHELERFAYVASHDLQEPLRMINSFTGLLETRYGDKLDDDARYYMSICSDAAKRMQALILDLLEYARVDSDAESYEMTNLAIPVKQATDNLHEAIKESQATIKVEGLPSVMINPTRATRLMQNLVGNAIKYRNNNIKPIIKITGKEKQDSWLISVSDNGIGMRTQYLDKIFAPFKRLHSKEEYSGTGIGLAICKKIVEQRGGKIWAESEPENGSIFFFTIPKIKK